jgi:hypothetical protein
MHGILNIQERAITRGDTTVYNSCVHTFRKSNNGTSSGEILAKFFLKPPFKYVTGAKDLQANIVVIVFVSGGK